VWHRGAGGGQEVIKCNKLLRLTMDSTTRNLDTVVVAGGEVAVGLWARGDPQDGALVQAPWEGCGVGGEPHVQLMQQNSPPPPPSLARVKGQRTSTRGEYGDAEMNEIKTSQVELIAQCTT